MTAYTSNKRHSCSCNNNSYYKCLYSTLLYRSGNSYHISFALPPPLQKKWLKMLLCFISIKKGISGLKYGIFCPVSKFCYLLFFPPFSLFFFPLFHLIFPPALAAALFCYSADPPMVRIYTPVIILLENLLNLC